MADTLLTTAEVAEVLRVHPKHVYRLLKRGLPARRVGSEWRFSRDEVLSWSGGKSAGLRQARPVESAAAPAAPPSLVAANGDLPLLTLLRLANALGPPLLGFLQSDLRGATDLLRSGAVLAAGAHAGAFPSHLDGERVARLHLVQREVGLVYPRRAAPLRLRDLPGLRLASRPETAGVRGHLDGALRAAGLTPARAHKRGLELSSHLEVVAAVVSGRADVGLASRAWGERFNLAFHPLATEAYGLIVKARDLGDPRFVRLCEAAQGQAFRTEAGAIAGCDAAGAGDIRYDA
jgi:excisionase family DNA binding protein